MALRDLLRHASIKTLFLVDAMGATLSAFMLGGVLVWYNTYIGMPINILQFLAGFALIFALYSWTCYFVPRFQTQRTIGFIGKTNLAYIILTLTLLLYHLEELTYLGILYFIGEAIVILILVRRELNVNAST